METLNLNEAFVALSKYTWGSSRAKLWPIDEAVRLSLGNRSETQAMESRLLEALIFPLSPSAREYVFGKLALVGSSPSVPVLATWLADKDSADPARAALMAIPHASVAAALRNALPKLNGKPQIGVINSLGTLRDEKSVSRLAKLLKNPSLDLAGAAAAALGNIGTVESARILLKLTPRPEPGFRLQLADACLVCAEHLAKTGNTRESPALKERAKSMR
jgi:hypothetical protein